MRADSSSATYRQLLLAPRTGRILATQVLGPLASQILAVSLVLLVLEYFDSPALAGLVALLSQLGVFAIPFAGAVVDSFGAKRLVLLDYAVSCVVVLALATIAAVGLLSVPLLIVLVTVLGITSGLSVLGLRTEMPLAVPPHLLDRANAMTFIARGFGRLAGPLWATAVATWFGPAVALGTTGIVFFCGLALVAGYREVPVERLRSAAVLQDTLAGLSHVARTPMLRSVSAFTVTAFLGWAAFYGTLPVFVRDDMRMSTLFLGLVYTVFAAADILSGLVVGRLDTSTREWVFLAGFGALAGCGLLLIAVGNVGAVLVGAVLLGIAETPVDQAAYSARQRLTPPTWMGRMTAVTVSLDFGSFALGLALAGVVAEQSPRGALLLGGAIVLCSLIVPLSAVRRCSRQSGRVGTRAVTH